MSRLTYTKKSRVGGSLSQTRPIHFLDHLTVVKKGNNAKIHILSADYHLNPNQQAEKLLSRFSFHANVMYILSSITACVGKKTPSHAEGNQCRN